MTVVPMKSDVPEAPILEAAPFIWLLAQCSRLCDRISVGFTDSVLEIGGSDKHGLLMMRIRLLKVASTKQAHKDSRNLLVESEQLKGASRLLNGASDVRLRFFDDRIDFISRKGGEVTFTVPAIEGDSLLLPNFRYHQRFKVP